MILELDHQIRFIDTIVTQLLSAIFKAFRLKLKTFTSLDIDIEDIEDLFNVEYDKHQT